MEEISELVELSESMRQVSALLADEDIDESKRTSTFLNVVGLGNVVCSYFPLLLLLFLNICIVIVNCNVIDPAGCWKICCIEYPHWTSYFGS